MSGGSGTQTRSSASFPAFSGCHCSMALRNLQYSKGPGRSSRTVIPSKVSCAEGNQPESD